MGDLNDFVPVGHRGDCSRGKVREDGFCPECGAYKPPMPVVSGPGAHIAYAQYLAWIAESWSEADEVADAACNVCHTTEVATFEAGGVYWCEGCALELTREHLDADTRQEGDA